MARRREPLARFALLARQLPCQIHKLHSSPRISERRDRDWKQGVATVLEHDPFVCIHDGGNGVPRNQRRNLVLTDRQRVARQIDDDIYASTRIESCLGLCGCGDVLTGKRNDIAEHGKQQAKQDTAGQHTGGRPESAGVPEAKGHHGEWDQRGSNVL